VTELDGRRGGVRATFHPGGQPTTLAFAGSQLWVGEGPSPGAHRGGTLALSGTAHLTTVDPAFVDLGSFEPTQLPRLAYDTLVTFDNAPGATGLRLVPDLALQLPHATDGGTTYGFRIRPGIRYSSGRPIRAGDFRRAVERLFRAGSRGASFYTSIVGASGCVRRPTTCDLSRGIVTDDARGTVTFHLAQPDPDFLFKLTEYAYTAPVPPATANRDLRWRPVPGTGPYRIVEASRDRVRLERNPYFREWSHAA
jgi:peptide/nickel transport system substrate-binding protein